MTEAAFIVAALAERGQSLSVAESLTGGLLAAAVVDVPGASEVFAGGIVAYRSEQKIRQLAVDAELIAREGTVNPAVARALALGVKEKFGTDFALSTTGVAGPGDSEGKAVGTIFVGIATPADCQVLEFHFTGTRHENRTDAVNAALLGLAAILGEQN